MYEHLVQVATKDSKPHLQGTWAMGEQRRNTGFEGQYIYRKTVVSWLLSDTEAGQISEN